MLAFRGWAPTATAPTPDGLDGLVVGHLLAALLALLLGGRDEARVQLHGWPSMPPAYLLT
jgi:hypothetical protein